MTETELEGELVFVTKQRVPSGVMASPIGPDPTETVAITAFVAVFISETELVPCVLPAVATIARVPSGVMATGVPANGIVDVTVLVIVSTTATKGPPF